VIKGSIGSAGTANIGCERQRTSVVPEGGDDSTAIFCVIARSIATKQSQTGIAGI